MIRLMIKIGDKIYWRMIQIVEDEWLRFSIRFIEDEWLRFFIRFIEDEWWMVKWEMIDKIICVDPLMYDEWWMIHG